MTILSHRFVLASAAFLTLGACAAPAFVSPVEVTRFAAPADTFLAQGTITIAPAPGTEKTGLEYSIYEAAVRSELEELGYRVVAQNNSQTAMLSVAQSVGLRERERGRTSVGVGGSTGSFGSGLGVGIGFDLSPRQAEQIDTIIGLTIRESEGGSNLWEGRAAMTATTNSEFSSDALTAERLADALFAQFPGTSGETVIIE